MFKLFKKTKSEEDFLQLYDNFQKSIFTDDGTSKLVNDAGRTLSLDVDIQTNMILLAILQELKLLNSKK